MAHWAGKTSSGLLLLASDLTGAQTVNAWAVGDGGWTQIGTTLTFGTNAINNHLDLGVDLPTDSDWIVVEFFALNARGSEPLLLHVPTLRALPARSSEPTSNNDSVAAVLGGASHGQSGERPPFVKFYRNSSNRLFSALQGADPRGWNQPNRVRVFKLSGSTQLLDGVSLTFPSGAMAGRFVSTTAAIPASGSVFVQIADSGQMLSAAALRDLPASTASSATTNANSLVWGGGGGGTAGPKGDKGDPGQNAYNPTFAIVADGNDRDLRITGWTEASGTPPATADLGNVRGPAGAKGDKGDTGDTGPRGPQGNPGADGPAGAKGDKGDTGDRGATGAAGNNAYSPQFAIVTDGSDRDLRITGWTESTGSPPATADLGNVRGPAGAQGQKGDTGDRGPAGQDGAPGSTGPRGPKGDTGDQGPAGMDGADGGTGPKGDKGDTGDRGPAGTPAPTDRILPSVSTSDSGKIAKVNASGAWVLADDETGTGGVGAAGAGAMLGKNAAGKVLVATSQTGSQAVSIWTLEV